MDDCTDLFDIARQAARNIQRRYNLDWTPEDYDDAAGWALVALVEAVAAIGRADAPRRYAFGVAQHAIIDSMLESVVGDLALDTALQRIAAAAAADPDGTRAALAPLLAVEAWQGEAL
jgi:hypothetical protein